MRHLVIGGAFGCAFAAYAIATFRQARQPFQRDLEWDALSTTSDRLSVKYGEKVDAKEQHRLFRVTGGFEACGRFFPVYERSRFNREWRVLRPIGEVASEVGEVLRGARA